MVYKIRLNNKIHTVSNKETAFMLAIFGLTHRMGENVIGLPGIKYVNVYYNSTNSQPKYIIWNSNGYTTPIYISKNTNMGDLAYVWNGMTNSINKPTKTDQYMANLHLKR